MVSSSSLEHRTKVLFVDDEIEILNAIKRKFSREDHFEVILEQDPVNVEGVINSAKQDNDPVKIIVSDVMMPQIDGINLLKRIKGDYPDIVRILLTARGDIETAIRAVDDAEIFGLITKPWEHSYLMGHLLLAEKEYKRNNTQIDIGTDYIVSYHQLAENRLIDHFSCYPKAPDDYTAILEKITAISPGYMIPDSNVTHFIVNRLQDLPLSLTSAVCCTKTEFLSIVIRQGSTLQLNEQAFHSLDIEDIQENNLGRIASELIIGLN